MIGTEQKTLVSLIHYSRCSALFISNMHNETEIGISDCLNTTIRSAFDSLRILVFRSTTLFIYPVEKWFDTNNMCDIAVWMGEAVHINYFTLFAIIGSEKTVVTRHRKRMCIYRVV